MDVTYGKVKLLTLKHLDELGTNGTVQTTLDVLKKIPGFINEGMEELCTIVRIPGKFTISRTLETSDTIFNLPDDFLWEGKSYSRSTDDDPWVEFNQPTILPDRTIQLSKYLYPIEITFHYWKTPTLLEDTVLDSYPMEFNNSVCSVLAYYAAGHVAQSEDNEAKADRLLAQYERKKSLLYGEGTESTSSVITVSSW